MTHEFIMLAATKVINFDPLAYTAPDGSHPFATLFANARAFFSYALAFAYLLKAAEDLGKAIMIMQDMHGVNAGNIQAAVRKME